MCELAGREPDAAVPLRDIADSQALSESYLEQLFLSLRRGQLVRSVRGAQGGYTLARDAADITVGDILRVLEGPIAPVPCVVAGTGRKDRCTRHHSQPCMTRQVWDRLARCMATVLDGISLASLVSDSDDQPVLPEQSCEICRLSKEV
jgi:Rrf2 family transcriptional regulator, cysteine metabolism repressor